MKPHRVQRKRTKGWKMPPNTVYVGRPTKWGNPFKIGSYWKDAIDGSGIIKSRAEAVDAFRDFVRLNPLWLKEVKDTLKGKNLACWCPLDRPCHADVLLELANR
jgi:hypothetical protein